MPLLVALTLAGVYTVTFGIGRESRRLLALGCALLTAAVGGWLCCG